MKKIICVILAVAMMFSIVAAAPTSLNIKGVFSSVTVLMSGQKSNLDSITYKDGIYLNANKLGSLLGKSFTWDKKSNSISIKDVIKQDKPTAVIEMKSGEKITLELYPEMAPNTVNNFIDLANKGFYDGLTFHRIIEGFMIQGGDPAGNGTGGPGYAIKGEFLQNGFQNNLMHTKGVISMARTSAPDSAGSQFFVMLGDVHQLNGEYAAFGKVIKGMEAVEKIGKAEVDGNDKPKEAQAIKTIRVDTKGIKYAAPQVIK